MTTFPGVGKTHLAQALGYEAIKQNWAVLYRSIFDLVRDFLKDEAFHQQDRVLRRYLKPDLLIGHFRELPGAVAKLAAARKSLT